jgi:hypothetical protein
MTFFSKRAFVVGIVAAAIGCGGAQTSRTEEESPEATGGGGDAVGITSGGGGTGTAGALPSGSSGSAGSASSPRDAGGAAGSTGAGGGAVMAADAGPAIACNNMAMGATANPFGCSFAWGINDTGKAPPSFVNFVSVWVGSEPQGGLGGACNGCQSIKRTSATNAIPVYYAYIIAFQGHNAGLGDCNLDNSGNLCTDGAQLIRDKRATILQIYANYAKMTYQVWPTKPLLWLIEPDFIQYTGKSQKNPLTLTELGQLASDIICAIKSNMPNAAVAINHSSWIRDPQRTQFFNAMPMSMVDVVYTTGLGNVAGGYINMGDSFNRPDGTYASLHALTKKPLFVDTSFGVTAMADTWSTAPLETLNQRIADGVVAVNVNPMPGGYQNSIGTLAPKLSSTCP